jgi:hypothetical protein
MSRNEPLAWWRHFTSTWEAMRLDLGLEEEALLGRIYDIMFRDGGPIPSDSKWLAKACRVPSQTINRIVPKLISAGYIVHQDGGASLWAGYVAEELRNAAERSENARKGADARWRKDQKPRSKSAESSAEPAEKQPEYRDNAGTFSAQDHENTNENKENGIREQCYPAKHSVEEGKSPTGISPSHPDSSLPTDTRPDDSDARGGASGPDRPYEVGQTIEVKNLGRCRIISIVNIDDLLVRLTIHEPNRGKKFFHQAFRNGSLLGGPFSYSTEFDAPMPLKGHRRSNDAA